MSENKNRNDREVNLTPWIIASVILHILIIFLYPEWQASAISTPSPFRDGVMQVSLRTFDEQLNTPALRRSTGPQPTVNVDRPDPQRLPERSQQPVEQAPVIAPSVRPEVAQPPAERVAEIRPEVMLPERLDRTPVETDAPDRVILPRPTTVERQEPVESPEPPVVQAPPTPQQLDIQPPERGSLPLPVNEAPERVEVPAQQAAIVRPDPVEQPATRPLPDRQPIMERPSSQVAPSTPDRPDVEVPPQPDPPSMPVAPLPGSDPQRPVPPPTYGSSLQFPRPGTIDPPKRMISSEVETVSVLITFDDAGSIVDAELVQETASADEAVNNEAPLYARYNVSITQPAPAGQFCQAVVQVTFSQVGGTSFSFNEATDRVMCFVP